MLKKISALVSLLLLGGCANSIPYAEWTPKEKKLYRYQLALQTIDIIQTGKVINCQKNNNQCPLAEGNPIYGKRPSMGKLLGIKVGGSVFLYALLSNKNVDREFTLNIMNTTLILTIANNQILINKRL